MGNDFLVRFFCKRMLAHAEISREFLKKKILKEKKGGCWQVIFSQRGEMGEL